MAQYMRDKVSGMDIPDEVIERMEKVPPRKAAGGRDPDLRGDDREAQGDPGRPGVHIMAIEWEEAVGGDRGKGRPASEAAEAVGGSAFRSAKVPCRRST